MTSTLPDFSSAPAAAATGLNAVSPADLGAKRRSPADDFDDLMSRADDAAQAAAANVTATASAPTLLTLNAPPAVESTAIGSEIAAADEPAAPATGEISRDTMEQAASFLAVVMQSMLPETQARAASGAAATSVPGTTPSVTARRDAGPPENGQPVEGPRPCGPSSSEATPSAFEVSLAADGAVEIKAGLPKEQGSDNRAATDPAAASTPLEVEAELALPGQAVMRLSASTSFAGELPAGAKIAGRIAAEKTAAHSPDSAAELKFLFTGEKGVKESAAGTGIGVAKTGPTMKSAPTEATRETNSPDLSLGLTSRGQFSVAWPSVDRTGETAAVPLEKNFAERAVATVANLVDTQFTASMQKSGSVQLRLKFGGEDLSVRVELRGGAVHTDFRTDSAELRAALNREWQAVASQSPDQLRQFVQPVFLSSTAHGDGQSSFARQQQAAAQQDQSQQRNPRARDEDTITFTRRTLVGETFAPQTAAPRVAALLPTSLRLSALA